MARRADLLQQCLRLRQKLPPLLRNHHAAPLEIIYVYGSTLKALIDEKFGPGIMSVIDFTMDIDKEEKPAGDRVVIKMNGKFLPCKTW